MWESLTRHILIYKLEKDTYSFFLISIFQAVSKRIADELLANMYYHCGLLWHYFIPKLTYDKPSQDLLKQFLEYISLFMGHDTPFLTSGDMCFATCTTSLCCNI